MSTKEPNTTTTKPGSASSRYDRWPNGRKSLAFNWFFLNLRESIGQGFWKVVSKHSKHRMMRCFDRYPGLRLAACSRPNDPNVLGDPCVIVCNEIFFLSFLSVSWSLKCNNLLVFNDLSTTRNFKDRKESSPLGFASDQDSRPARRGSPRSIRVLRLCSVRFLGRKS